MAITPILRLGAQGVIVRDLQRCVGADADGKYGPQTVEIVRNWQMANGLAADGIAGPLTLQKSGAGLGGVDLSHWQVEVSPRALAREARFAWIKAAHGRSGIDRQWASRRRELRSAGIPVGAYHFVVPNRDDPIVAAQHMCRTIGELAPGELAPALDIEDYVDGMTAGDVCAWAIAYLAHVKEVFGINPIVYTGAAFLKYRMGGGRGLTEFPLWIARYRNDGGTDPGACGHWQDDWRIWQWTGSGEVTGVRGRVDCNYMRGSIDDFMVKGS